MTTRPPYSSQDSARSPRSGTQTRTDYSYGVASLRTGALDDASVAGSSHERLMELAAILPEVFGTVDVSRLGKLWERLGGEDGRTSFQQVVILSDERVHVIEPIPRRPDAALLTVTSKGSSLGLVLSTVHAKLSEFEDG